MEIKTIENLNVYKVRYRIKPDSRDDRRNYLVSHREFHVIAKNFQEVYTKISRRRDFDSFIEIALSNRVEKI